MTEQEIDYSWIAWDKHTEGIVREKWAHETPQEIAQRVNKYLERKAEQHELESPTTVTSGGVIYRAHRLGIIEIEERDTLYKADSARKRKEKKASDKLSREEAERQGNPYRYIVEGWCRLRIFDGKTRTINGKQVKSYKYAEGVISKAFVLEFWERRSASSLEKQFKKRVCELLGCERGEIQTQLVRYDEVEPGGDLNAAKKAYKSSLEALPALEA